MAELAQHDVKLRVAEGQPFDISLAPIDFYTGDFGVLAGALEKFGRKIQRRDTRADAGGGDGDYACAAGYVEHLLAGLDAGKLH